MAHALDAAQTRRLDAFGLPLDACETLSATVAVIAEKLGRKQAFLTTFINPAAVAASRRSPGFAGMLRRFDLVLPDGIGMSAAVARLQGRSVARVSFDSTSLALPVFGLAQERGLTVALVGGVPGVAARAAEHLETAFPGLRIVACIDGYADRETTLTDLCALDPDVVVCGMGSLVQEEFLDTLVARGWKGCGFTCGGYLDQLGNGLRYYPAWVDRTNLRFLYRLAKEPRRLWRRYLLDYPLFVRAVLGDATKRALMSQATPA